MIGMYVVSKDTVAGLWSTNKQSGWMKDGSLAEIIYHGAVARRRM